MYVRIPLRTEIFSLSMPAICWTCHLSYYIGICYDIMCYLSMKRIVYVYVHVLCRGVGFGREGGEIAGGRPVPLPFWHYKCKFSYNWYKTKRGFNMAWNWHWISLGNMQQRTFEMSRLKKNIYIFVFGGEGGEENVPGHRARCSNV